MLGKRYVPEGVLPTTAKINILRRGTGEGVTRATFIDPVDNKPVDDVEEIRVPVDWLEEVALVDTPGTNAVIVKHERLAQRIIPRADLVIFLTSAERPFSESERLFLERISAWRKKVVLIVNKLDILPEAQERNAVVEFVRRNGAHILGGEAEVFAVSARLALSAKIAARPAPPSAGAGARQWADSNFAAFEEYMVRVLSREERVRSKLLSPIGVAEQVAERMVEEQLTAFMEDMQRDIRYERLSLERVLENVQRRADDFIEKKMRLTNLRALSNRDQLRKEFERDALGDMPARVDAVVADMGALVAARARAQSMAVLDFVGRRQGHHARDMVGRVHDANFTTTRTELLDKLEASVRKVVVAFSRELRQVHSSILEGIAPYARFVRTERSKNEASAAALRHALQQLEQLKADVMGS
ncbi:P-loop containing nucleoside triphosphate hydrolase protein [Tribonema minus]|uniref:P-loop containing nucleoside triphosphate hydrolase protein n=1 Tax=Tribonema minus TaxID=303371 RepID=A0A836C945_9STRA|nr:P-loop containing nucleoside triphosphate hydrolase protein [Tribonema minus]